MTVTVGGTDALNWLVFLPLLLIRGKMATMEFWEFQKFLYFRFACSLVDFDVQAGQLVSPTTLSLSLTPSSLRLVQLSGGHSKLWITLSLLCFFLLYFRFFNSDSVIVFVATVWQRKHWFYFLLLLSIFKHEPSFPRLSEWDHDLRLSSLEISCPPVFFWMFSFSRVVQ